MAWLYEKSAVWRGIVAVTAASPWAMAGFTGVSLGAAYYMGKGFMWLTEKDPEQAKQQLAKHDDRMSSQVRPVSSMQRRNHPFFVGNPFIVHIFQIGTAKHVSVLK